MSARNRRAERRSKNLIAIKDLSRQNAHTEAPFRAISTQPAPQQNRPQSLTLASPARRSAPGIRRARRVFLSDSDT
ncbi:hypothetical protein [Paraburkholderia diazotrophica]|uniref:hypothetical protein n=1 Tax=Paraburkholderia diazotrophica TaxID=667676 RepID=UPI000B837C88|nr:hypothetical protein [Paraburkholderia diazotrophica]